MKSLYIIFTFFLLTVQGNSQPFDLFTNNTSQEFATTSELWERSYSLHVDSIVSNDEGTFYHLHSTINLSEESNHENQPGDPDECYGWGGCYEITGSTGFGDQVYSPVENVYHFITDYYPDTLVFNFNADSGIFFQNEVGTYVLVYEGTSTQEVFSNEESVQHYRIAHYDENNNLVDSPLNGFIIRIGENSGLIDFFAIDNFPENEIPLTLIGDDETEQGIRYLTSEMVYDFQPGDTLQYRLWDVSSASNSPIVNSEISFLNKIFLNRTEDEDSLRYEVLHQSFQEGGSIIQSSIEELVYPRFDTLAQIPFNRFPTTAEIYGFKFKKHLSREEYCGENLLALNGISSPHMYCELYGVWCDAHSFGPPEVVEYKYVEGLGLYNLSRSRNGYEMFDSWSNGQEIIYYSKGANVCGEVATLSNPEREIADFNIYPNPTHGLVRIELASNVVGNNLAVDLIDLTGKLVDQKNISRKNENLDYTTLPSGIYILHLRSEKDYFGSQKLVLK